MRRVLLLFLTGALMIVVFRLWGPDGVWFRVIDLRAAIALQESDNKVQRARNEELSAELYSLVQLSDAVEEKARRELFMTRPEEVLFRFETPDEYEKHSREVAQMPDYANPDIKPNLGQTLKAKRANLYFAPKHLWAPKSRYFRKAE